MISIGIMTVRFHNYGTILQALALQYVINHLVEDADAEFINCYANLSDESSNPATHLLYCPISDMQRRYHEARAAFLPEIEERRRLFNSFIDEYIKLSEYYEDYQSLKLNCKPYDVYMTGGDQTMNTLYHCNKAQFPYLLAFTNNKNKIAYGCGMNKDASEPFRLEFMTLQLLSQYKKIMVREELGAKTLERYLNQSVEIVLDPTLLLSSENYYPFMKEPDIKIDDAYIFAYFLNIDDNHDNDKLSDLLSQFARKAKKRILLISSNIPINNEFVTTVVAAGPAEWLWLVANAEYVITNTYHGACLSIVFNKPFYTIGRDSRKASLLDKLSLSDKLGPLDSLPNNLEELYADYSEVNKLLNKEIEKSKRLLTEAICE